MESLLAYSIPHLTKPTTSSFHLPSRPGSTIPKINVSFLTSISGSRTTTLLPEPRFRHSRFRCKSQFSSNLAPLASAAYGAFLLGGGLFAYSKSESRGSLFGGLTGGALMGIAYRLMLEPETKHIGDALAFGSALLFAAVFGIRFASTRKIMPGGVLLGLSVGALAVFYSAYLQDKI